MSHIVFDWDDTLAPLNKQIAGVLSSKVGHEVLPEAICTSDWTRYYGVDCEQILEAIDPYASLMRPGMAGLLNELLLCGHRVTIVTARRTQTRMDAVRAELNRHKILGCLQDGIEVVYSSIDTRAEDVKALEADVFIDDRAAAVLKVNGVYGIATIQYGTADIPGFNLLEQLAPQKKARLPRTIVRSVPDLRRCLTKHCHVKLLPSVIGLIGAATAGKDTAGLMIRQFGTGYQQFGFALALKSLAHSLLDREIREPFFASCLAKGCKNEAVRQVEMLYKDITAEDLIVKTAPGRLILQLLGTELVREGFGDDIWVDQLALRVCNTFGLDHREGSLEGARAVLTDVRYLNESKFVKEQNGLLIHIERKTAGLQGVSARHSSESLEALKVDYPIVTIENNGTFDDLKVKLTELLLPNTTLKLVENNC